jgi:DNA-binding MarR family transcriptional regulator
MLLVKIGRAAERWFTDALKPSGLTPRHVGVLYEVRARPTSQQALIDSIGVDPSKLVGLLNDLEAEGLIVRRRDPEDRRRHIVEVSKEGRTRLAAAERAAGKVEARLFEGLDDAQRKELHGLLAQVADSSGVLEGCVELLRLSD